MLLASEIKKAIICGDITISDFRGSALNPNSYNLRTGDVICQVLPNAKEGSIEYIDPRIPMSYNRGEITEKGCILFPGFIYLIPTMETVSTDKYVPIITGRSNYGRMGVSVHREAGFGDIGFSGKWTLQIDVIKPTLILPYTEICQVYFSETIGEIEILYDGKYQNAHGVLASQAWKDFI